MALRCFPSRYYSQLKNIFVIATFPSAHFDKIDPLLSKIVDDINSSGTQTSTGTILFKFAGLVGDNLGLNQLLGFVESFSANHYCRICRCHKKDMRSMIKENVQLLRTEENYADDFGRK